LHVRSLEAQPRDVASRTRKARDEAITDRLLHRRDNDGNRLRRLLGCKSCRGVCSQDDIDIEAYDLVSELRESFRRAMAPAPLDCDVAAFDVAEVAKSFDE
jgi:hypothetical protein